jgi:hypothetical protein
MTTETTLEQKEFEARIEQLLADARYNTIRAVWHPILMAATLLGAGAAIGKLFW